MMLLKNGHQSSSSSKGTLRVCRLFGQASLADVNVLIGKDVERSRTLRDESLAKRNRRPLWCIGRLSSASLRTVEGIASRSSDGKVSPPPPEQDWAISRVTRLTHDLKIRSKRLERKVVRVERLIDQWRVWMKEAQEGSDSKTWMNLSRCFSKESGHPR